MPRRNEDGFKHERAAFDVDMAAARAALEVGQLSTAVDLAVTLAGCVAKNILRRESSEVETSGGLNFR
ncbi:MAG TPA: hypothetical protein VE732_01290 [Nitrososphaera sp.]|jgi:hypothetical protein|nr:hypothetical protein [Nitrososphaera sp.]